MNLVALAVAAVLFVATLIRSTLGFGEALFAVPLLALLMPVEVAAPVAALVSITVAALVMIEDWRKVHAASAWRLVLASMVGIPFGLALLKLASEGLVKTILGLVIIAFAAYFLKNPRREELSDDRLAWLFGFGAGILGGAYGMNGPPLVIYGGLRKWSPVHFRATLQGYFLPASMAVMGGYWLGGLWTTRVSRYYLISLPVILLAVVLGRFLNRRLNGRRFLIYAHVALALLGAALVWQAWRG